MRSYLQFLGTLNVIRRLEGISLKLHNRPMSEEHTRDFNDKHSFEDRVFARFDAIERRFDGIETRLESLEVQNEKRALETKPIWERALAEILEVKEGLWDLKRKIDVLSRDIVTVRADQVRLEDRFDKLNSKPS